MAEHAERTHRAESTEDTANAPENAPTEAIPAADSTDPAPSGYSVRPPEPEAEEKPRRGANVDWRRVKNQVFGFLASVVRWVGLVFAGILVLHIIFVIGEANRDNSIVSTVRGWADSLSIGFQDLFTQMDDAKLKVLVNYGIAAVFWLVVSIILAKIIRRVTGAN